jgi:hypothetical protein
MPRNSGAAVNLRAAGFACNFRRSGPAARQAGGRPTRPAHPLFHVKHRGRGERHRDHQPHRRPAEPGREHASRSPRLSPASGRPWTTLPGYPATRGHIRQRGWPRHIRPRWPVGHRELCQPPPLSPGPDRIPCRPAACTARVSSPQASLPSRPRAAQPHRRRSANTSAETCTRPETARTVSPGKGG